MHPRATASFRPLQCSLHCWSPPRGSDDEAASTEDTAASVEESAGTTVETTATTTETTDASTETTDAATDAEVPVSFGLPTAEMSADDAAALADITLGIGADPTNLEEGQAPGVLYGVWDPELGVHLTGAGLSEIDSATPMAPDMSFRIGSITKTFTATAVLLLVDDGKVDLDEPVATYTGDLTATLPGRRHRHGAPVALHEVRLARVLQRSRGCLHPAAQGPELRVHRGGPGRGGGRAGGDLDG